MLRGWRARGGVRSVLSDAAAAACACRCPPPLPPAALSWGALLAGLPASTRAYVASCAAQGQLAAAAGALRSRAHAGAPWSPAAPAPGRLAAERRRRRRRRAGAAAVALSGGGTLAALAAADFDTARTRALAASAPRTFAAARWCARASYRYQRCRSAHPVLRPRLCHGVAPCDQPSYVNLPDLHASVTLVKNGRLCTIREGAADKGQGALRLGTCRSHSTLKGRVRQRRSSAASARPPFSQARRCFAQDAGSTEHQAALAAVHRECAAQLLRLCQANGGVYIKAAQLVSTIQSVPKEYRECAPGPSYSQRGSRACKRPHLGGPQDTLRRKQPHLECMSAMPSPARPQQLLRLDAGMPAGSPRTPLPMRGTAAAAPAPAGWRRSEARRARAQDAGGAAGSRRPAAV